MGCHAKAVRVGRPLTWLILNIHLAAPVLQCKLFFICECNVVKAWHEHVWKHFEDWHDEFEWLQITQTGLGCTICSAGGVVKSSWSKFRACRKVPYLISWSAVVHKQFFDIVSARFLPVLDIQGIGQVPIFAATWTNFPAPTGSFQSEWKQCSCDRWKTCSLELFLVEFKLGKDLSTRHAIVLVIPVAVFKVPHADLFKAVLNKISKGNHSPEEDRFALWTEKQAGE